MTRLTYQLGPCIGEGATGTVYQATLSDGRLVAVKRLKGDKPTIKLRREAAVLARLDHPNVVQFYALQPGTEDDQGLELITELVSGTTLSRLRQHGRLPVGVVIHILREVLAALAYVHTAANLVHRDLSPRNILISTDGQVKVADFGLAKPQRAERTTSGLRGTPPYISPEQVEPETVAARSDLFALGVNLYELLTGVLPFEDDGLVEMAAAQTLTPPIAHRPELPRWLDSITRKMLEYDPEKRPSSAAELLEQIPAAPAGEIDRADIMRERFADPAALLDNVAEKQGAAEELPEEIPGASDEPSHQGDGTHKRSREAATRSPRRRLGLWAALAAGVALGAAGMFAIQSTTAESDSTSGPLASPATSGESAAESIQAGHTETPEIRDTTSPGGDPASSTATTPTTESADPALGNEASTVAGHRTTRARPSSTTPRAKRTERPSSASATDKTPPNRADPPAEASESANDIKVSGKEGSGVYYPGGRKEAE